MNDTRSKQVFTATFDWWQTVGRNKEIEIDDGNWTTDAEVAANLAELSLDDEESWVACVTEIAERHSAIKIGDYACCQGIGSDVIFVRLN